MPPSAHIDRAADAQVGYFGLLIESDIIRLIEQAVNNCLPVGEYDVSHFFTLSKGYANIQKRSGFEKSGQLCEMSEQQARPTA